MTLTDHSCIVYAEDYNYDESKVPKYELPDPLKSLDGHRVETKEQWINSRRPEVLELFRKHVYGRSPAPPTEFSSEVFEETRVGDILRKQIALHVGNGKKTQRIDLLLFLPAEATKPTPMFLLLNFRGNHAIDPDPAIKLPSSEVPERYSPPEEHRGAAASRHPVAEVIARGYGVACVYCGDLDPDYHDEFKNGVHALFDPPGDRPDDAWGTISAWAWGLSRVMDYFETDDTIDHEHVAVLGHSRLGKTSLWAGAQDERFAIVISNDSGCGGAALSRRRFGETVERINRVFPHWFCENFKNYNDNEDALPVDQHMLIALAAPRPVYVASATEDRWADPRGEFLSCLHAEPVYELFGLQGLGQSDPPEPDQLLQSGHIGYHVRTGKHDLDPRDWFAYLDFADKHWGKPD